MYAVLNDSNSESNVNKICNYTQDKILLNEKTRNIVIAYSVNDLLSGISNLTFNYTLNIKLINEYIVNIDSNGASTNFVITESVASKWKTDKNQMIWRYNMVEWNILDWACTLPTWEGHSFNGIWTSPTGGIQVYGSLDSNGYSSCTNEGTYWLNNRVNFKGKNLQEITLYVHWK